MRVLWCEICSSCEIGSFRIQMSETEKLTNVCYLGLPYLAMHNVMLTSSPKTEMVQQKWLLLTYGRPVHIPDMMID